jgi:hypothetical protein
MKTIQKEVTTRLDQKTSAILQYIPRIIKGLPPRELLRLMELIQQCGDLPADSSDLDADNVFRLCAMAGFSLANSTASAIEQKEREIVSGN